MKRGLTILLAIVMIAALIIPFAACEQKVEIPDGVNLSIMSFNIRQDTPTDTGVKDWDVRKDYLIAHVKEQAPALLCMQEVRKGQASDLQEGLSGYETIWYSRKVDESEEGLAIAYDTEKFEYISDDMFWLSETPDRESKGFGASYIRICVHAILKEIETQREISVYCVHLDVDSRKARIKEIEMVMDKVKADDREAIVCGDFNTTKEASAECFEKISGVMYSAQETALNTEDGITYQGFGSKLLMFDSAIDFIYTTSGFFAKDFNILDEYKEIDGQTVYYSDHYAVKADVVFKS